MYEHRHQPLLSRRRFVDRLKSHLLGALALLVLTLAIGMAGYHWLEDQPWIDAYLNASMILGGMGPVAELHTAGGKLMSLDGRASQTLAPVILHVLSTWPARTLGARSGASDTAGR